MEEVFCPGLMGPHSLPSSPTTGEGVVAYGGYDGVAQGQWQWRVY